MTRYEQGFMNKCAEYGVDGAALLEKQAAPAALQAVRNLLLRGGKPGAWLADKGVKAYRAGRGAAQAANTAVRNYGSALLSDAKALPGQVKQLGGNLSSAGGHLREHFRLGRNLTEQAFLQNGSRNFGDLLTDLMVNHPEVQRELALAADNLRAGFRPLASNKAVRLAGLTGTAALAGTLGAKGVGSIRAKRK